MIQFMRELSDTIASKEAADGAISIEYVLIAALVVGIVGLLVAVLSPSMSNTVHGTGNAINKALADSANIATK